MNTLGPNDVGRIAELERQVRELQRKLAQARAERDDYLGLLQRVAPEYAFTAAEVAQALVAGSTLSQIIHAFERGGD